MQLYLAKYKTVGTELLGKTLEWSMHVIIAIEIK